MEMTLQKVTTIEQNVMVLQLKKVEHKDTILCLYKVWLSRRWIEGKIVQIKLWQKVPICARVKKGLKDKK